MKRLALLALAACTSAACSITVPNGTGPSIRTVTVTPPATSPTRTYAQPSTPSVTGPKTEIDSDGTYVVGVDILRTYRTLAALAAIGRGYVALIPATSLTTTPARKPSTFSYRSGVLTQHPPESVVGPHGEQLPGVPSGESAIGPAESGKGWQFSLPPGHGWIDPRVKAKR